MSRENEISVLLIEPMKAPKMVQIPYNLAEMQKLVGGNIQEIMPFDDEVALICNEEGKNEKLPLNRAIYNNNGKMIDIVAGDFFICLAPFESEHFKSLPKNLSEKYSKQFECGEQFILKNNEIEAIKIKPQNKDYER